MDTVLLDGDQVMFMPNFGQAVVVVQPGSLRASGSAKVRGKAVCIQGDESSVSVPGCVYVTPVHVIPGTGTLEISGLRNNHSAAHSRTGSTRMLLVGGDFDARFSVQSPAQQPNPSGPPVPDATPSYSGQGSFLSTNQLLRSD